MRSPSPPALTVTGAGAMPSHAEHALIARSARRPHHLVGIVGELDRRPPSASTTLQTSEIAASSPSTPAGAQPMKSLVRLVPQPIDRLTCPRSARDRVLDRIDVHRVGQHDRAFRADRGRARATRR